MTIAGTDQVTPLILTFNEEPNLARSLDGLGWASTVVVLDSGSTDSTESIARRYPNVRWCARPFDTHAEQWRYGVHSTGITTRYVLALDADYIVTTAFARELAEAFEAGSYAGGSAGFDYRILGRDLLGSVYPAKLVLFDRERVEITQPGHSQELTVAGPIYRFRERLIHDDRKPTRRFVTSQLEYARLEELRLRQRRTSRLQDRLRRAGVMPLVAGCLAYVRAGGLFRGRAALRYAYERATFECLLALLVLERSSTAAGKNDL